MSGLAETDDGTPEMLAGEYVLGTLDAPTVRVAEARIAAEPAFAADVRAWEARLYPLTLLAPAVAPPASLWARIEDTVDGAAAGAPVQTTVRAANDNRVASWWRSVAIGAAALAAGLAVFIGVRPVPAPLVAVLAPAGSTAAVLVAVAGPDGGLALRPTTAVAVAAGKDLELWALPAGATKPVSLGVLPASGKMAPRGVVVGTRLLVSLEPKGGSPTGAPTGPVVYGGVLQVYR